MVEFLHLIVSYKIMHQADSQRYSNYL